jgi:hypothetical protein
MSANRPFCGEARPSSAEQERWQAICSGEEQGDQVVKSANSSRWCKAKGVSV